MEGDTANTAIGEFEYCSIHYGEIGIEMKGEVEVSVSNSNISNNETSGIYNYEGNLVLNHSELNSNEIYGLNSLNAVDSVTYTTFYSNKSYGIKIQGTNPSNDESYLLADTITYPSGENNTQYGIYIKNNNYIKIDLCKVKNHNQGGLKLENSDSEVLRSSFESNDDYGLYTLTGSTPKVRRCIFDTLDIAVKAVSAGIPDLGDTTDCDGENSFLECDTLFIHFSGLTLNDYDTLYAQRNWRGDSSGPDPSMLYVDQGANI